MAEDDEAPKKRASFLDAQKPPIKEFAHMNPARERATTQRKVREGQRGFGSTLSRFPAATTRIMIGTTMEAGDAGKYLEWEGAQKPVCGGLGFSFNDRILRRHTSKSGPMAKDARQDPFGIPKGIQEDLPNYSYYDKAEKDNQKAWDNGIPNGIGWSSHGATIPRIERFHELPKTTPMPSVGAYQMKHGDVQKPVRKANNPFNGTSPRIPKVVTEPSPSMTQYEIAGRYGAINGGLHYRAGEANT